MKVLTFWQDRGKIIYIKIYVTTKDLLVIDEFETYLNAKIKENFMQYIS